MPAKFHHVHLKAPDPRKTAKWWADNFGAKILGESESRGSLFVRMDISGVLVNVSSLRPGETPRKGDANVHLGLEHIALTVDDLAADLAKLSKQGIVIQQPLTETENGGKMAFIVAPEDVRVELIQLPPSR